MEVYNYLLFIRFLGYFSLRVAGKLYPRLTLAGQALVSPPVHYQGPPVAPLLSRACCDRDRDVRHNVRSTMLANN